MAQNNEPKLSLGVRLTLAPLRALARLPFGCLFVLSDLIRYLLQYVIRYRRKVIVRNVRMAYPDLSDAERAHLVTRFYRHFCDMFVENIKLLHITDDELRRHIRFGGLDLLESYKADDRPVVVFMGHVGNWEWMQALELYMEGLPLSSLYKPAKSDFANQLMGTLRGRFPHVEKIPSKQALRRLVRYHLMKKKFLVAFIADQRTADRSRWLWFYGQKTTYYTGGEDLAKAIDAHPVYLDIMKPSRGHYEVRFLPIDDSAYQGEDHPLTHAFMHLLEENLRRQPELWLWSHNRWKKNHLLQ